ncbi:RimK family alpha-L-glutamate ligase [Nocardia suismassiliense]|uniref:RimK family alpha-L-glutamate ligase n=1 Tax=Nocardia suismassiliense TaxID=2077092 RepID=A0ABW6QME6_9NOCA
MVMRIGIIASDLDDPDSPELARIGREMGHDTSTFFLWDVGCRSEGTLLAATVHDMPVAEFDVIISRVDTRDAHAQEDRERYSLLCRVPGVTILDPVDTYLDAESKLLGLQRLGAAGLPIAPTRVCRTLADVDAAFADWGAIVAKASFGFGGQNVERVRDPGDDRAAIAALLQKFGLLICQPYYPHPEGDLRITVVGDQAPLSASRVPPATGWKSNIKTGATARIVTPDPDLVEISVRATRAMGLSIAGLDFLPTADGYRIIEFNSCPGWYWAPEPERRRFCAAIIDFAVSAHKSRRYLNDPENNSMPQQVG